MALSKSLHLIRLRKGPRLRVERLRTALRVQKKLKPMRTELKTQWEQQKTRLPSNNKKKRKIQRMMVELLAHRQLHMILHLISSNFHQKPNLRGNKPI